jgi:peptidoglycan/LPS O-acetylase OafA/YrhL
MDKPLFRQDINALRAFAVLAVIAYHFDIIGFGGGFVGVDIFFVISGFLITTQIQQSLVDSQFSFVNFYVSRLRRIVPALAVMCFAILVLGWLYIFPSDYISYSKNAFQALYFGSNHSFGVVEGGGGYFDAVQTSVSPFLHTWSLSVEGQFYLILPVLWVLIYKRWRNWQTSIVFALLAIALSYFAYDTAHHTSQSFYSLSVRAWEFLVGACLVVVPIRCKRFFEIKSVANASSLVGLSCIFLSVHFINVSMLWPSAWTLLPVMGAVMVLLATDAASSRWLFHNWFVQRTGDLSYSLYLWHWPVIVFAKHFISAYDAELNANIIFALLCATVAASYVSWKYIEKPVRKNRKFWTNTKIIYGFIIVVVVFWGVWRKVAINIGFPNRFEIIGGDVALQNAPQPPSYGAKCIDDQRKPVDKDKTRVCKLNDNSAIAPEVLVWGDSHMHHYYPAWRKAAHDLSINGYFMARGGCHAAPWGEESWQRYYKSHETRYCLDFNSNVHVNFLNQESVKTVVLGRKWFDGEAVTQTIELSKQLTRMGKKVILIGAIPKPEFNVGEAMIKRKVINFSTPKNIFISREKMAYLDNIDQYVKVQLALEIANKKVIWIDAMKYFCSDKKCNLIENDVPNFWDASHITEAKALEFTEEFKRALKQ